ncbi:MAG: type II CAAX endopeptidase family protein [Acidobacteriota bacterium]
MRQWVARHDTAVFLIVTYGISWPLWFVSGTLTRTPIRAPDLSWLVAQIGVFAPAFAGMVVGACVGPGGVRRGLRLLALVYAPAAALGLWIATRGFPSFVALNARATWTVIAFAAWALAWVSAGPDRLIPWPGQSARRAQIALWSVGCVLVPAGLFLAAWVMTASSGGGKATIPPMPVRELTPSGLLAALAVNLVYGGSLGEEPGWRGAWLPRLLRAHNPLAASLIISFWWALWHAPIDFAQGFGLSGIGALGIRQVWTLPVAIIFTWVTLRAGGSLLPPILLHATLNAIPDFALGEPAHYESALGLFLVFLVAAVVAAAIFDSRLRNSPRNG